MEAKQSNKKKITIFIIAGSAFAFFACLCVAIIVAILYFTGPNTQAKNLIKKADTEINQAETIIAESKDASSSTQNASSENLKKLATEITDIVNRAGTHLTSGEKSLKLVANLNASEDLKNKAGSKLKAVRALKSGLEEFKGWASELNVFSDFLANFTTGTNKQSKATDLLNKSINEANANNFSSAKTDANQAIVLFNQAKKLYLKANEKEKDKNFAEAAKALDSYVQSAKTVIEMAKTGKSNTSAYNSLVDQLNTFNSNASSIKAKNAFLNDPQKWVKLKLQTPLNEALKNFEDADKLYTQSNK